MLLHALNKSQTLVSALQAVKYENYRCLECNQFVRLRRGLYRRSHFYHIEANRACRLNGKTMRHIQTQAYIQRLLSKEACRIEYPFPSINRIADVAWLSQKIVFEVQCSPISVEELLGRNQDYQSVGWEVVWILHDQRYNRWRLTAIELALQPFDHYFTNIDEQGQGMIYDLFYCLKKGVRFNRSLPFPVQIQNVERVSLEPIQTNHLLKIVKRRLESWKLSFEGSLMELNLNSNSFNEQGIRQLKEWESSYDPSIQEKAVSSWKKWFEKIVARPYRILFDYLLETACK